MRSIIAISVVVFIALLSRAASGQSIPALPNEAHIVVVGQGSAEAAPDYLEFTVAVSLTRPTGPEAAEAVNSALLAIRNALLEMEIAPEALIVNALSLEIQYDYQHELPRMVGVEAHRSIEITLHDLVRFEEVSKAAIDKGATSVHQPRVRSRKEKELWEQAQQHAIRHAREQARSLAAGCGYALGPVHGIATEESRRWSWNARSIPFGDPREESHRSASLTFTPRPVERSATVYAVFLLGPPLDEVGE